MSNRIIVGYDGSNPSGEAVRWAAVEAEARHQRLCIVSCVHNAAAASAMSGWVATEAIASSLEATELMLVDVATSVARDHPGLELSTEAYPGPAEIVLVNEASPDDLIVVGASSHERAAAFWLGSTPRYVVRHGACPVIVVRGPVGGGRPDRIVVGIDGSPDSSRALRWAGEEADLHHVDLVVVHAWLYPYLPIGASSQARDLTKVDAECVLDVAVEQAREHVAVDVIGQLVEHSPVAGLLESLTDGDLLVLGSRGRGAVMAGLFGSTVNSVLERCPVPVAVVPAADA